MAFDVFNQVYEYCTIQDLRDEGLSESFTSDARAKLLIRRSSSLINRLTGQWFYPIKGEFYLSGKDNPLLYFDWFIPILKIYHLEVLDNRVADSWYEVEGFHTLRYRRFFGVLGEDDYQLAEGRRYIELLGDGLSFSHFIGSSVGMRVFPKGRNNIRIDCVIGWLEDVKNIELELVSNVAGGALEIFVNNVDGLELNDVILFDVNGRNKYRFIKSIDSGLNKIEFYDSLDFSLSAGDIVYCFGRVPTLITEACVKLAIFNAGQVGTSISNGGFYIPPLAMYEEKTDRYRYRLSEEYTKSVLKGTTGYREVDVILQEFVPPVYPEFA